MYGGQEKSYALPFGYIILMQHKVKEVFLFLSPTSYGNNRIEKSTHIVSII